MKISDMLRSRDRLKAEAEKLVKAAEERGRAPEDNEQKRLDEIRDEVKALDTRIKNRAMLDELDRTEERADTLAGDDYAREMRNFSLTRLLASTFEQRVDAGREREICQEQANRTGKRPEGFLIPFECLAPRRPARREERILTVSGDASSLISNEVLGDQFIDALRPQSVATRLGARTITGLTGDIALPRRDARTPAAAWFEENSSINSGDQSFDQVTGTPKHLGLITEYGRKTLLQTSPQIEDITREHFLAELASGLDLAVMKGSGSAGQPTGITQTGSIGTKDSSSSVPTWQDVLDVMALVEDADVPAASMGFALNAQLKSLLRGTVKVSGEAVFIMDDGATLGGAPVAVTSQLVGDPNSSPVVDAEAIFGAWNEVIVGMWSGMEILVNPFESTAYSKGNVSVRGIVDADVMVRHPEAFVHWQNVAFS